MDFKPDSPELVSIIALFGAIPGIMFGVSTNSGIINPVIFGIFGAIGATVGVLVVIRRITTANRP